MLNYNTIAGLVEQAEQAEKPISELVLAQQAEQTERTEGDLYEEMRRTFRVMEESVASGIDPDLRSTSGLTGGAAYRMQQAVREGRTICGEVFGGALTRALAVSELNASMGRIVASPTAGSCGILPAAVLTIRDARGLDERTCVMSLFTASAVGMVIANNACLAGAQGGCQAECG